MIRPEWWFWEIEITPHIEKRMFQRGLTELELRTMLHSAKEYDRDIEEGRFRIKGVLRRRNWDIVVEPDLAEKLLVVITAYPIEDSHAR